MSLKNANKIHAAYWKEREKFERQHELLLIVFRGTPLIKDMGEFKEAVDNAFEFNVHAGWVSEYGGFDKLEYFISIIKRDYRGRLVKNKADIPSFLASEFDDLNEEGFARYMEELRDGCRCAYSEMSDLRGNLKYSLSSTGFIDELCGLPENFLEWENPRVKPFFDNIGSLWDEYEELAKSLLHMANKLGDEDYDPSLMEALLFD